MDKDIQDIFKEKNKEMLITNLKYDLDKNIGSLMETISNILNLEFDIAIKKIEVIYNDASVLNANKYINEIFAEKKFDVYEMLNKLVVEKKKIVLTGIERLNFEKNSMNEYYDLILNTTKLMKEKIERELLKILIECNHLLCSHIDDDLLIENIISNRLQDYLEDRLYEKIETKLHMEIMLRDNNLINKAKEGYLRYQEICSNTL